MSNYKILEKSLAILEENRPVLTDEVVDAASEAIHRELARLEMEKHTIQQRKLVSFLFLDVVSSTKTFERLDPEDVLTIMNDSLRVFGDCVEKHGGFVARLMGDALLAFFGAPISHEDDAERAVRAGLDILEAAKSESERITSKFDVSSFQIRVGINTGHVALGEVGGAGMEYTAMGDAINVAKHIEAAAPHSGLLISQDTYRHIRGKFDVDKAEKMQFKGREGLTQTYVVKYAKPRGFHVLDRMVEGIEIPMVGRDKEMEALQTSYMDSLQNQNTHIATVIGEAGVGKSRLLAEFDFWVETLPGAVRYLAANVTPQMKSTPYSLFHELFLNHLEIHDKDTKDIIHEKFEKLVNEQFTQKSAHIMGEFLGFDFSDSPHLEEYNSEQHVIHDLGAQAVGEYFQSLCAISLDVKDHAPGKQPTVIFFDDIQWADPGSHELIVYLSEEFAHLSLMIIAMARPQFLLENPKWGLEIPHHTQLEVKPLSIDDSEKLIQEILQKVKKIPGSLRKLIVKNADGNPFYIEELIHMLIEEEIIIKGEEHWWVEKSKLKNLSVPPTLTGIVQARLDKLPKNEKALLQRAAVIGQVFWDDALNELAHEDEIEIGIPPEVLADLQSHQLVVMKTESVFEGAQEFVFKSAIIREVAYESVLKRQRNRYHERTAEWLIKHSEDHPEDYVSLVAEHYLLSGNHEQAIPYLQQAAELAMHVGDYKVAVRDFEHIVRILPDDVPPVERIEMTKKAGIAYLEIGDVRMAEQRLQSALELARQINDTRRIARILTYLGENAIKAGQMRQAHVFLEEGLPLARECGDPETLAFALMRSASLYKHEHDFATSLTYFQESLNYFRQTGDKLLQARTLRKMGSAATQAGNYADAQAAYEESLQLCAELNDRWCQSNALNSLGDLARVQGDLKGATSRYEEALELAESIANHHLLALVDLNLGNVARDVGEKDLAYNYYLDALHQARILGLRPVKLSAMMGLAALKSHSGEADTALQWAGMALNDSATNPYVHSAISKVLDHFKDSLSEEDLNQRIEAGKELQLEAVVEEVLAERG